MPKINIILYNKKMDYFPEYLSETWQAFAELARAVVEAVDRRNESLPPTQIVETHKS